MPSLPPNRPKRPLPPVPTDQPLYIAADTLKGRGTAWALAHRFQSEQREQFDDGWGSLAQSFDPEALPPSTQIIEERAQRILSGNQSPDIPFDQSINPYRGCEHVIWQSLMRV